jgi:VIT1/CCC1 family predicted Fe2+/Mn2+ transporter
MEKFSLYDLLAVLFPGIVFIYMLNAIRNLFGIFSCYNLTEEWELLIVLSMLFGALIYVVSFTLVSKLKWLYKTFGLYTHVTDLYYKTPLHDIVGDTLNKRADEWFHQHIFMSKPEFDALSATEKTGIRTKQDEFYDRMYYELDYAGKLDTAKTFQSFYLFFRNIFIASFISIVTGVIICLLNLVPFLHFAAPTCSDSTALVIVFAAILFASVSIARWYRSRMVYKMYWYFYSHINAKK